jgi:hypothetical protein
MAEEPQASSAWAFAVGLSILALRRLNTWNLRFHGLGRPVNSFSNSVAIAPAFFNWSSIASGGRPDTCGIPLLSGGGLSPAA